MLFLPEPSEAPDNLHTDWIENHLILKWTHPNKTNGDINYFNITLIPDSDKKNGMIKIMHVSGSISQYNYIIDANELQPSTKYEISVCANNDYDGKKGVTHFTTHPQEPFLDEIPKIEYTVNKTISVIISLKKLIELNKDNVNTDKLFLLLYRKNWTNLNKIKFPSWFNTYSLNLTGLQIVYECDIINSTMFHFMIGKYNTSNTTLSNCQQNGNISLETGSIYNVTIILRRTFENKTRLKLYSSNIDIPVQIQKKMSDVYASVSKIIIVSFLTIIIIFIILITIFLVKYIIKNTEKRNTLEIQREEFPLTTTLDKYSKQVTIKHFEDYVKESMKNKEFERQYEIFRDCPTKPWSYGLLPANVQKNRYTNLIAYDHTRVVLGKVKGQQYSDYINANYIDSYKVPRAYIATQGPTATTVNDFWRMIWQKNVNYIIMLANVSEGGKQQVEKYWPEINNHLYFGDITVQYMSNRAFANYEHRIFHVTCRNQLRSVNQLHFLSWPDHGVPLYPQSLLPLIKCITSLPLSPKSPVVLHCSAGAGRTGTVLLCDIALRMAADKSTIDMLKILYKMRNQRANMVANVVQYKLAHFLVLEYLFEKQTGIPCNEVEEKVEKLINGEEINIQMKYIEESMWKDKAMRFEIKNNNHFTIIKEKNRYANIIPEIHSCIFLSCYPVSDSNSIYINAVNVDGYRCPEKFIVTQQPLPNTLGDFWRLVYEKEISLIISLNEINLDDPSFCAFWPNSGNPTITPVDFLTLTNVNTLSLTSCDVVTVHVKARHEEKNRVVRIMSVKNWHACKPYPERTLDLLALMEKSRALSHNAEQVIITCYDGATASGLYTAMDFVIEKIKFEQLCDVCEAVRTVRRSRSQFLTTKEQFIFLYKTAADFIRGFQF